jgi:hypothetical protein
LSSRDQCVVVGATLAGVGAKLTFPCDSQAGPRWRTGGTASSSSFCSPSAAACRIFSSTRCVCACRCSRREMNAARERGVPPADVERGVRQHPARVRQDCCRSRVDDSDAHRSLHHGYDARHRLALPVVWCVPRASPSCLCSVGPNVLHHGSRRTPSGCERQLGFCHGLLCRGVVPFGHAGGCSSGPW